MNSPIKLILSLIFFITLTISPLSLAQEKTKADSSKHEMKKMDCCKKDNSSSAKHSESSSVKLDTSNSIALVDKNQDGKVFIDGMCKDVIKDEPGRCPKCGMKLKEVTLKQAEDFIKK